MSAELKAAVANLIKVKGRHNTEVAYQRLVEAFDRALAAPSQPARQQLICREDGRCQYAIDVGEDGSYHCPEGGCVMPHLAAEQAAAEGERQKPCETWCGLECMSKGECKHDVPEVVCPSCGSEEWDRITNRVAPGEAFNRCNRCELEWVEQGEQQ